MTGAVIAALLAVMVGCVWLGCAGLVRLRTPLDRLHCVAFVNATAGTALTAAAFVADGASSRALKMLLILAVLLVGGAATAHASGRALTLRQRDPERGGPQ